MTSPDIQRVLDFWFEPDENDSPSIDSRMNRWFTADPAFDERIRQAFGALVDEAQRGGLGDWSGSIEGRLALILVLDQFMRNVHRGTGLAFAGDRRALGLCVEGAASGAYRELSALQQVFFFMPLQHAESLKIQERSVRIYQALAASVPLPLRETFATFAQFAELHRDIVADFGRFPHRNAILGRANSPAEDEYLTSGGPSFGQ